ncbi:hypothetical protein N302_02992, partial [Corvus brachyrhynchos]
AAIDYLLLIHRHGCEDFEGLCCFNLSSSSKSIHVTLREMKDHMGKIQQEMEDWFNNL